MAISFKVSKKGTRFHPKPKPQSPSVLEDNDKVVDTSPQLPQIKPPSTRKRSVDDIDDDDDGDVAGILDAEVSFILNIFTDGYTIKTPSEGNNIAHENAVQNDPKLLFPYDRTSENLFAAIECGRLPADFFDDIPFKYSNGAVACEVRDYRRVSVPCITKLLLKMSLNNVVNDIHIRRKRLKLIHGGEKSNLRLEQSTLIIQQEPENAIWKEIDKRILIKRFSRIKKLTERLQLNRIKKQKIDPYKKETIFPTQHLTHFLLNNKDNNTLKDGTTCTMPLSKSLVGGTMNVCKTRVLNFVHVSQGKGVPKMWCRLMLSEKQSDGTVAMHYGEVDDCDYLAKEEEELLPTFPNTRTADLFAYEFCSQMWREGYRVESDNVHPKPTNMVESTVGQLNSGYGLLVNGEIQQITGSVSQLSISEVAKPSNGGTRDMPSGMPHQQQPIPQKTVMSPLINYGGYI